MEKILSVSVASYNLGDMIQTNVESFCKSNVADKIELIITDDGSKDNTPEIIEKLAKQYPNTIKFIIYCNTLSMASPTFTIFQSLFDYFVFDSLVYLYCL